MVDTIFFVIFLFITITFVFKIVELQSNCGGKPIEIVIS